MKNSWRCAIVLGMLASAPAIAADMPLKAPPAPVAPAYSWGGAYIGGNVGAGWGQADTDASQAIHLSFNAGAGAFQINGPAAALHKLGLPGPIGGGQAGYNVQAGRVVFGIETDLQASAQHVSTTAADPFRAQFGPAVLFPLVVTTAVASGTTTTHYQGRIAWFGTVRGRLGVASDRLLIYGTGGLAYGRVSLDASMSTSGSTFTTACIAGVCNPPDGPFGFAQAATLSGAKVNYGWTAGGGFEWAAARNLSFKAEYIYLDLGSVDVSSIVGAGVGVGRPAAMHARFNDHVVRIGFNYRFADQAGMSP